MRIIRSIKTLRRYLAEQRGRGHAIGFIPTMGFFHEGHLSLMRRSVRENDISVVSLFVNPLQFGPGEDFQRYPRDLKRDAAMARRAGVNVLFVPEIRSLYPSSQRAFVDVQGVSQGLCGDHRPGHFRGVATVVAKLLHIVRPDVMYLGQKDAQQVAVLKAMVRELDFGVKVAACPTVREPDGLAMSSRNAYLSLSQREAAAFIYRSLLVGRDMIADGEHNVPKIIYKIKQLLSDDANASIEYVSCVDPETFVPLTRIGKRTLIAVAVHIGTTRLIDNIMVRSS